MKLFHLMNLSKFMKKKNILKLIFLIKKYKNIMFFYSIKKNNDIDNPTIIKNFNILCKLNLNLTKSEISHNKNQNFRRI